MSKPPCISRVHFTTASGTAIYAGLIGWATVCVDDRLVVDVDDLRPRVEARVLAAFIEERRRAGRSPS